MEYFRTKYGHLACTSTHDIPDHLNVPYIHESRRYLVEKHTLADALSRIEAQISDKVDYLAQTPIERFEGITEHFDLSTVLAEHGPDDIQSNIWVGSKGTKSGFHYDLADNILVQIRGVKQLWLASPNDTGYMYPFVDARTKSWVDPMNPEGCPDYVNYATVYEGQLNPGDIIFIPTLWWHYVKGLEPSISLNVFFGQGSVRDQDAQEFTNYQRLRFRLQYCLEFTKATLGFPRPARLFTPLTAGSEQGNALNSWMWSWFGYKRSPVSQAHY